MAVRIVEWQLPYTWGTGIEITTDKVINLLLREENNLILVNDDNEIYTDLQLEDWILPTDDFPVGVTVGKVLESDWWTQNGLLLNRKTTSGDYARWIYWADGKLYFDWGTGTWSQVYYSSEVDALFTALRWELATVAFTGDYNDLINRPAFLQEQADWDEVDTQSPSYILNKPTIPTVNDATLTIQKNNISQWTFTANSSTNTTINIPVPNVINNLTSTSTSDALSANQGYVLDQKIQDLQGIGRFLSLWDCSTGQPISFPLSTPYNYATWDYFLVETVSSANPPVNYRPSGTQYTGTASSATESDEVEVWDLYIYDGAVWLLQINHGKTVSFANLAWQPSDNAALDSALGAKQDSLTLPATPTQWNLVVWWTDNETLADWWAVPTVPTNVSAFSNDSGYITSASLPWTATSSTAWLVKLASDTAQSVAAEAVSSTAWRTYWVQLNSSNQMVVNVPRTNSVTSVNGSTWAVTVSEFTATNGWVKVFTYPMSWSVENIVTWYNWWGSVILRKSDGDYRVTKIWTNYIESTRDSSSDWWTFNSTWEVKTDLISFNSTTYAITDTNSTSTYSHFKPSWTATTGYVVTKTAWGYEWAAPTWWIQLAPNSTYNVKYHRYGTQAQYEALNQYYTDSAGDTAYFTI